MSLEAAAASAAAPVVVSSATESDGLINRAFKIVMIGALLAVGLGVAYAIGLIAGVVDFGEVLILRTGILGITSGNPILQLAGAGLTALGAIALRR